MVKCAGGYAGIGHCCRRHFGMHGSGLFIVNPLCIINPLWRLQKTLQKVMPYLVGVLGQGSRAGIVMENSEK